MMADRERSLTVRMRKYTSRRKQKKWFLRLFRLGAKAMRRAGNPSPSPATDPPAPERIGRRDRWRAAWQGRRDRGRPIGVGKGPNSPYLATLQAQALGGQHAVDAWLRGQLVEIDAAVATVLTVLDQQRAPAGPLKVGAEQRLAALGARRRCLVDVARAAGQQHVARYAEIAAIYVGALRRDPGNTVAEATADWVREDIPLLRLEIDGNSTDSYRFVLGSFECPPANVSLPALQAVWKNGSER